MRRLMSYAWPGNVRQLENAIERAVAFGAGRSQIDVLDLPPEVQQAQETVVPTAVALPEEGLDLDSFVSKIERELIHLSLARTGGNKGQAARLLNLKRTTLVEKLKRLYHHAASIRVLDHPHRSAAARLPGARTGGTAADTQ